jgi:hypothetical protein
MKVLRLPEPELRFKNGLATYCKVGLNAGGPYDSINDSHKNKIVLGVIGTKELVDKTRDWVALCNDEILSKPHKEKDDINKELFPDFPGCSLAFETTLVVEDRFVQEIKLGECGKLDRSNDVAYTKGLLALFEEKLRLMLEIGGDVKPDVILCVLTEQMYDLGHAAGDYHTKLKRKEIDPNQLNIFRDIDLFTDKPDPKEEEEPFYINFRSMMKKIAMSREIGVPVQLLRPSTIIHKTLVCSK